MTQPKWKIYGEGCVYFLDKTVTLDEGKEIYTGEDVRRLAMEQGCVSKIKNEDGNIVWVRGSN